MFIFFDFGHYIGRGRRSKIGGGDKLFTSWKEHLLGLEKVSFQVLGSTFSIVATRLGSSAEPSQQVC